MTGAGISAECGIPTFRDDDGLWSKYPPEVFGNLRGLLGVAKTEPRLFACFIHDFIEPLCTAEPGEAHKAITGLQARQSVTVMTQNVDGLHQRAGTKGVLELHGTMFETINLLTRRVRQLTRDDLSRTLARLDPLRLKPTGRIKLFRALRPLIRLGPSGPSIPNVVLFGQSLPEKTWALANIAARVCDCLVVVGTSRTIYPAASLVDLAEAEGATIIQVDPQAYGNGLLLKGPASEILPELCA